MLKMQTDELSSVKDLIFSKHERDERIKWVYWFVKNRFVKSSFKEDFEDAEFDAKRLE
jgi:hypothetical protein